MTMRDLKTSIRAERHPGWNEVVRRLLSDRTRRSIGARKAAGLIVRKRNKAGRSLVVLPLGKEKLFDQIAGYCCTRRGPERALSMLPVGVVVVGVNPKGEWAHKVRTPDDETVSELLLKPEFMKELTASAYTWAADQINGSMNLTF